MSIPKFPTIMDDTNYIPSTEETLRYSLFQVLFGSGLLKGLTDKGKALDAVGKDSTCLWTEAFFYYDLIEYLILFYDEVSAKEATCDTEEFKQIYDSYDFDCIQKTLLCRYGSSGIVDALKNTLVYVLYVRLDICCISGVGGVSLMNINSPTCNTFTIYPAV